MAVKSVLDIDLIAIVDTGDDIMTGDTIYKNRYISNINTEATPQQAYDCVVALMGLQKHYLYNIKQREQYEVTAG